VRVALFVPLYMALEYLLTIGFFGVAGRWGRHYGEFLSQGATLAAALIAGGVMISALDTRQFGALGFARTSRTLKELSSGFAIGGGALAIAAVLMVAARSLTYVHDAGTAASWVRTVIGDLAIFAIAAAAEEAVFRGYGFQVIVRAFGPVAATIGTAALFAFAHVRNPNITVFALANIFLAGVFLGLAYLRTMSLWFATAVHAGWNWVMASLLDLPVSGLNMFQTPLYEPVNHGAKWVSGGTFGPEGGIVGTIGLTAGIVVLMTMKKLRVAPEMTALRPIALAENIQESA
jgi:membrane protease YdiL (CAAX protease family)